MRERLEALGYVVGMNTPYAGGFTTETYGRPTGGYHRLQIEIDRSLYLDEARLEPLGGVPQAEARPESVVGRPARNRLIGVSQPPDHELKKAAPLRRRGLKGRMGRKRSKKRSRQRRVTLNSFNLRLQRTMRKPRTGISITGWLIVATPAPLP